MNLLLLARTAHPNLPAAPLRPRLPTEAYIHPIAGVEE